MAEIVLDIVKKEKNFTIIDNGIFKDNTLSAKAKGVLTTMLSLPPTWKYSIEGLATLFSDGETAIRSALQELEASGYLRRNRLRDDKNRITGWRYTLYEVKQPLSSEDSPHVENPHVDFPLVENKAQLSTNKLSTKEENNTISKDIVADATSEESSSDNSLSEYEQHMYSEDVKRGRKIIQQEDTEKKPRKKPKNKWDQCVDAINEYTQDEEFRTLLLDYLVMRLQMKDKPMYANQWKGMLNSLNRMDGDKMQIVRRSLENGWAGFFEIKRDRSKFGEHARMSSKKVSKEEREEIMRNGQVF